MHDIRNDCHSVSQQKNGRAKRISIITTIVVTLITSIGGGLLWAADVYITEKIDKNIDKKNGAIVSEMTDIRAAVEKNTESVNNLTLTVVTMQITDLQKMLGDLDLQRDNWSQRDRLYYLEKQRELRDLMVVRDRILGNLIP